MRFCLRCCSCQHLRDLSRQVYFFLRPLIGLVVSCWGSKKTVCDLSLGLRIVNPRHSEMFQDLPCFFCFILLPSFFTTQAAPFAYLVAKAPEDPRIELIGLGTLCSLSRSILLSPWRHGYQRKQIAIDSESTLLYKTPADVPPGSLWSVARTREDVLWQHPSKCRSC